MVSKAKIEILISMIFIKAEIKIKCCNPLVQWLHYKKMSLMKKSIN